LTKGQRGFTLIELLAVMAILGVLVAVVAPAVTGTKEASVDAQTLQDATQVRSAATDYFKDQEAAEVRAPHTVTTVAKLPVTGGQLPSADTFAKVADAQQVISSRWPEKFITHDAPGFSSVYLEEITTNHSLVPFGGTSGNRGELVDTVVLLDQEGKTIMGSDFLKGFTAIDVAGLVTDNYLPKEPAGLDLTSDTGLKDSAGAAFEVKNFLWLFKKTTSTTGVTDDSRDVAVFKLVKVDQHETASKVNLTYQRIF
jgi:prepilin-type N-terminal cleavage/methylation domain-containing protein